MIFLAVCEGLKRISFEMEISNMKTEGRDLMKKSNFVFINFDSKVVGIGLFCSQK